MSHDKRKQDITVYIIRILAMWVMFGLGYLTGAN